MRGTDGVGLTIVVASAIVAIGLGHHGLAHPGPMTVAGGGGLGTTTGQVAAGANTSKSQSAGTASQSGAAQNGATSSGNGAANSSGGAAGGGQASNPAAPALKSTGVLLSTSQYGPYAVELYPHEASGAGPALDGFGYREAAAGTGSIRVTITIAGGGQTALTQVVPATDKVYFIEGSMNDDAPGSDVNGGDDGVIVTNAKGYILQ